MTMSDLSTGLIKPTDESFHPRSDSPYWNESSWIQFMIPEREIDGWVYFYHRPNMNLSAGGVALWDRTGEQSYDCKFYEWDEHQAMPPDADMYDFTLRNGLSVKCLEPLRSIQLSFENEACQLELRWEASMDPFVPTRAPAKPANPGMVDWGTGHYDQLGRVQGSVLVEGESLPVDSWSMRDRSWGPRQDGSAKFLRISWPWAAVSEDAHFSCWAVSPRPFEDDPIAGTTEAVVNGWYMKDGVLGQLISGERRVVERAEDGRPLAEVVDAVDHLGRQLYAEGHVRSTLKWHAFTTLFSWWSLATWEFDGHQAWGEMKDFCTVRQMRRFQQDLRSRV